MPDSLLDLLEARSGIVCAVGAGGKKTVLQHLARMHPGRVALTASVVTTHFPDDLGFDVIVDDDAALVARVSAADARRGLAYACPSDKPGRHAGVPAGTIERIHAAYGFAASYVKADGARMRWIKAPAADEPVLPRGCTTLIAVVSARAINEPLGPRSAHRIEQLERVTGLAEGGLLSPTHVGRLIAHPEGLMKFAAGRRLVPLINMVDDPERESLARAAAEAALELAPGLERVVLARLSRADDPVVAVVRR